MYDILIVGAGASGMAAAVAAKQARPEIRLCVLEKNRSAGRKVAASGNGRCNITNTACEFSAPVRLFFEKMGVITKEERDGRVYPYSEQAAQVVNIFVRRMESLGVELFCGDGAKELTEARDGTFCVCTESGKRYAARKVLIATGGKASPAFGTTGDGYAFARKFGHGIVRLAPALTMLEVGEDFCGRLGGIRAKGRVSLLRDEIKIAEESGEIQFTEKGISGIAVFNLSRFVRLEEGEDIRKGFERFSASVDFMPEYDADTIKGILREKAGMRDMRAAEILDSIADRRIAEVICERNDIPLDEKNISEAHCGRLAAELKNFQMGLCGAGGWKNAQCTSGGIPLGELDMRTMQSEKVKNLYFSGEIIDYDGPCGGYNLQNAWETGIKAGIAMAGEEFVCTEYMK